MLKEFHEDLPVGVKNLIAEVNDEKFDIKINLEKYNSRIKGEEGLNSIFKKERTEIFQRMKNMVGIKVELEEGAPLTSSPRWVVHDHFCHESALSSLSSFS